MISDIRILPASASEPIKFDWGTLTWFAGRALMNSEDLTVGRCVLWPGRGNPRHRHPNCSEVLVVIQGRIHHTAAEGQTVEMGEGDTVTIPPNVWHHAVNVGTVPAILFISFSSADRETIGSECYALRVLIPGAER